jgi:dihydropteroate synthase
MCSPLIMGILNITPDSFSDGNQFSSLDGILRHVESMIQDGASIVDVGGESTRPFAEKVSVMEELDRVIPVVEAIVQRFDICLSIDTMKAEVMQQAVQAGAHMINDVRALQEPGALHVASELQVPICLMHMQSNAQQMQISPTYQDVVEDIIGFFQQRIEACLAVGIARERLVLDPGFGFGKTCEHNYSLLRSLEALHSFNLPLLVGMSRKQMIGDVLQKPVHERIYGSVAAASIAAIKGAHILRVHDVAATSDALKITRAVYHNRDNK